MSIPVALNITNVSIFCFDENTDFVFASPVGSELAQNPPVSTAFSCNEGKIILRASYAGILPGGDKRTSGALLVLVLVTWIHLASRWTGKGTT